MAVTADFDSNPRTIYGTAGSVVNVRFVDKSTSTSGVINSWLWRCDTNYTWIPDGLLNNTWIDVSGNLAFAVGDRVMLSTTITLPTGLSASVVYWVKTATTSGSYRILTLSLTNGGPVVSYSSLGSGTMYIQTGSDQQNPVVPYTIPPGGNVYTVIMVSGDSAGGSGSITKASWIKIITGSFTPPVQTTAYRNITIFVYERSTETSPKSTCICRTPTLSCNLFFQNLQVNGAITKAGKATFDIISPGNASAIETDLFESGTGTKYKNVAIIAGYDVIWSGKITRADKELRSQPATYPQKCVYRCEAYSDVKKLSDWNIVTPKSEVGKTPGAILTDILATNTGEPDFIGTKGGFIDTLGTPLQMTLSDTDKLTAFSQLTNATDYDWRTRMDTMLFQYAAFNAVDTIQITIAGFTPSDPTLLGAWVLFTTNNIASGLPNTQGVMTWGRITGNGAAYILATMYGKTLSPATLDNCLIIKVPRMDFSSDLQEPTPVRAFTNNVNCVQFKNADDKVELFTKIIARGKSAFQTSVFAANAAISVSLPATQPWDSVYNFFKKSTYVTQKTDGYVYSYGVSALSIVLIGQGYALKSGEVFYVYGIKADGTTQTYGPRTVSGIPTTQTQTDGTLTTTVSFTPYLDTVALMKYSTFISAKTYVKDYTNLSTAFPSGGTTCLVGKERRAYSSGGTDATYGPYIYGAAGTIYASPHSPGCFVTQDGYPETAPGTGSPVAVHGIITKPLTTDTATTLPDLEVAATNALIQGSQYYQKSTMSVSYYQWTINRVRDGVQLTGPAMIREGQRI